MKKKIANKRKAFKRWLKKYIQLECIPFYNNSDNTMRECRSLTVFGFKVLSCWEVIKRKERPAYLS